MAFIEDLEEDLNDIEYVWSIGAVTDPNLSLLLDRLKANILTEAVPHAQYRAILRRAARPPLGVSVTDFLRLRDLEVSFRSLRNIIEVDEALTPYYGNVIPALGELQALGLTAAAREMWLDAFQHRSPVNRVVTVAQMLAWAALLLLDTEHPALGAPSRAARNRRVVRPPTVVPVDASAAILLKSAWTVTAYPTPDVNLGMSFTLTADGTVS